MQGIFVIISADRDIREKNLNILIYESKALVKPCVKMERRERFIRFPCSTDFRNCLTRETGSCETLCEMELCERFKQSAQALELLHERKMWNEQKPYCLSAASLRFLRMFFHILSEC